MRLSIDRDSPDLSTLAHTLSSALAPLRAEAGVRDEVLVALLEAVANALRHGRRPGGGGRPVLVDLDVSGDQVTAAVTDDGPGFDPAAYPDPRTPERLHLPTGRGLLLMRHYMDSVDYTFPPTGGTVLTLHRSVLAAREEAREEGGGTPGTEEHP
ncbi:ATP-binding protein [Streptomyces sp. NPDC002580]|uniref:ATP-binding protein n=1 Tax=Streptomyces sp. NPDC002580 TaxID=3364653 RepID=UPI00369299E0